MSSSASAILADVPAPAVRDGLLAAAVCAVDLTLFSQLLVAEGRPVANALHAAGIVAYAAAGCAVLVFRRRAPVTVFVVVLAHALLAVLVAGYRPTLGILVALYTVAAYRAARPAALALAGTSITALVAALDEMFSAEPGEVMQTGLGVALFFTIADAGAWALGRWARASRQHAADLEYRRGVAAREAAASERTRIAREMHDIVAHTVTVMILQAAGARRVLPAQPARVERTLCDIERLGVEAMGELRRMLTVLRDESTMDTGGNAEPPHGLADLDMLLENVRSTGVVVRLIVSGTPVVVGAAVDATAYRIVQEALTNVSRHAGPGSTADVRIDWTDGLLRVDVHDDGRGTPSRRPGPSSGHGLLGLRERVRVLDGQLEHGPSAGGFRVTATLPADVARTA